MEIILGSVFIIIALLALTLQRFYSSVPVKELKRLALSQDQLAISLHRPAAYGQALRLFLWIVVGVFLAGGLTLLSMSISPLVAFLVMIVLFSFTFVWLPSLKLTLKNAKIAVWFGPAVTWAVAHAYKPLAFMSRHIASRRKLSQHSQLYEYTDFLDLVTQQREQSDNRIIPKTLDLIERAVLFNEKQAADIVLSRAESYVVNADDIIGPVLLDKLHKYAQASFLVYKDSKENIIGSLTMRDAVAARAGGRILDHVHGDLTFVHEDFTLAEVTRAFIKTGTHLVVVVNSFEEFVGTITLESLMDQLFGSEHDAEPIPYDNRRVVASFTAKRSLPAENDSAEATSDDEAELRPSSPEATEVVE